MDALYRILDQLIGLHADPSQLTLLHTLVRATMIYLVGLFMLRFGEHRFIGKNTAFDVVLGFIFGSMLSRAINGAAPFFDTILAGGLLLGVHWLFADLAYRSDRINVLLNGKAVPLVKDGAVQEEAMRSKRINERLLYESLRVNGTCEDLSCVRDAYYERNGAISVIPPRDRRDEAPRVVEVQVEGGVQTVRIELAYRSGGKGSPPSS